jgi:hypothetical protein
MPRPQEGARNSPGQHGYNLIVRTYGQVWVGVAHPIIPAMSVSEQMYDVKKGTYGRAWQSPPDRELPSAAAAT